MKKRMVLLCLSITCMLSVTACQSKETAEGVGVTAQTEESPAITTNYATTEELSKAAGFSVLELPAYWGKPTAVHMDTNVAAVDYEFGGGGSAAVSSAKLPNQDITVGMGKETGVEKKNGADVHISQSDDKTQYSAWWSDGILSYAVDALKVDEDTFKSMIEELTGITAAYPGGVINNSQATAITTNYATTEELSKAAGFAVLELPMYWGTPAAVHLDANIAAVDYEFEGTGSAVVSSAKLPNQDITAGTGKETGTEKQNNAEVHIAQSDDKTYYSAWWSDGILSYSVEALNVEESIFKNMIEELTGITEAYPGGVINNSLASMMANPMVEYDTYEEAEKAVGFKGLYLIAASGYDIDDIYVINNSLLSCEYEGRDTDYDLDVRTSRGTKDNSGFYGVAYKEQQIAGVAVHVGTYKNSHVAWWTNGTYAFSVSAEKVSQDIFNSLAENLVEASKTLK